MEDEPQEIAVEFVGDQLVFRQPNGEGDGDGDADSGSEEEDDYEGDSPEDDEVEDDEDSEDAVSQVLLTLSVQEARKAAQQAQLPALQ